MLYLNPLSEYLKGVFVEGDPDTYPMTWMSWVTGCNLEILRKVLLTVQPSRKVSAFRRYFYITNKLALPVDALLGLNTMRELGILISLDSNEDIYKGEPLKGMSDPSPLAFLDSPLTREQSVSSIVAKQRLGGEKGHWPTVSAKVEGTQEIPDRAAKTITIRVDKAKFGSDVCIDGAPNTCRIAVEWTISRVREGNLTEALVVHTSGAPITLNHGQHIGQVLVYGRQVASEPQELPSAYVSTISSQIHDAAAQQSPSLEPFIKVTYYSEMKPTLLQVLEMHRPAIALPGEQLGVTHCAKHHIKLKPGSNPVHRNAYQLPQSQRQLVEELIKDMLDQGVIQGSNSPWNSPLFLMPKKDGTLRPVIDFRRVNEVTVDDHYPLPVLRDLLMCLGRGNKVFSSLDFPNGYWQLPMAPESREVTAFSMPSGHFEWTRMPFSLKQWFPTFFSLLPNLACDIKHVTPFTKCCQHWYIWLN